MGDTVLSTSLAWKRKNWSGHARLSFYRVSQWRLDTLCHISNLINVCIDVCEYFWLLLYFKLQLNFGVSIEK